MKTNQGQTNRDPSFRLRHGTDGILLGVDGDRATRSNEVDALGGARHRRGRLHRQLLQPGPRHGSLGFATPDESEGRTQAPTGRERPSAGPRGEARPVGPFIGARSEERVPDPNQACPCRHCPTTEEERSPVIAGIDGPRTPRSAVAIGCGHPAVTDIPRVAHDGSAPRPANSPPGGPRPGGSGQWSGRPQFADEAARITAGRSGASRCSGRLSGAGCQERASPYGASGL